MRKICNEDNEKRDKIINAGLFCFGNNGYKKTSMQDIGQSAEVSKALVFHYFSSKKKLYLFLYKYCSELISNEIETKWDYDETDFFEKIKFAQKIKIGVIKRYPAMFDFMKSAYFENDRQVEADIKTVNKEHLNAGLDFLFVGTDFSKFKEGVDPQMVMKIIIWCSEGYFNELSKTGQLDMKFIWYEFDSYLVLLKNNFYREENLYECH